MGSDPTYFSWQRCCTALSCLLKPFSGALPMDHTQGLQGLYDPANEHDACGIGFIAHGADNKSIPVMERGLQFRQTLPHRGAGATDKLMGDGAGVLIQIPDQ